jgi:hypothetical protein
MKLEIARGIENIKHLIFYILRKPIIKNTYAQVGEDVIIKFLFDGKGINKIHYLELGTYHPDQGNNTYLFYLGGSRGVCVEADETLIKKIKQVRPEDIVLNVGIGTHNLESADFYIFNEPSLNTFNLEEAKFRESQGSFKIVKIAKVMIRSVGSIIADNYSSFPDLLSIDLEGLDFDVLKTIDFSRLPIPVVCVETCSYSENHIKPKNEEISEFMLSVGYFIYADTYVNTIFVNKGWFNKI